MTRLTKPISGLKGVPTCGGPTPHMTADELMLIAAYRAMDIPGRGQVLNLAIRMAERRPLFKTPTLRLVPKIGGKK